MNNETKRRIRFKEDIFQPATEDTPPFEFASKGEEGTATEAATLSGFDWLCEADAHSGTFFCKSHEIEFLP